MIVVVRRMRVHQVGRVAGSVGRGLPAKTACLFFKVVQILY